MSSSIEREFAESYITLVEKSGDANVSVSDIARRTGRSRKTFYRHFDDIDDLIVWHYRDAMKRIVEEHFSQQSYVYPDPSLQDKYEAWPFYARLANENGGLDQGDYFEEAAAHFERHPAYYRIIFKQTRGGHYDFPRYMRELFTFAIKGDILYLAHGKMIPPEHIDFLAEYHAAGIVGRLEQFVSERSSVMSTEHCLHWNYAHTTMLHDLDAYFSQAQSGKR